MKSVEEILHGCPKHDCAYVLYNGRWHRIEEHELRWLELAVMKGECEPPKLKLNGINAEFDADGALELPPHCLESNIYCLNGNIHMEKIKILRKINNN